MKPPIAPGVSGPVPAFPTGLIAPRNSALASRRPGRTLCPIPL